MQNGQRSLKVATLVLAAVTACGGGAAPKSSTETVAARLPSANDPSVSGGGATIPNCESAATAPSRKLLPAPQNPIPDQYLVAVIRSLPLQPTVDSLVSKYGGHVIRLYESALYGFFVEMNASQATALASDSAVCFVEQNATVRID
jgi:hypothetical protein